MCETAPRSVCRRLGAGLVALTLLVSIAAAPAAAHGGESVTLTGTLRAVIGDDFDRGRSATFYALETADGPVQLVIRGGGAPDLSGRHTTISGTRLRDGSVLVDAVEPWADGGAPSGAAPAADGVSGWAGPPVRRVALVIGTYTDATVARATAAEGLEAMDQAAASVRAHVEASSRGRVTVDTTVLGPWSLGIPGCPFGSAFDRTQEAVVARAAASGVHLAAFDHVVMWTPDPCASGWTALGEAPGQFVHVSAPYPDDGGRTDEFANVVAHEMGHNMGLLHANAMACTGAGGTPAALSTTCTAVEYGDPFSTMGGDQGWYDPVVPGFRFLSPLFDASELAHLGWLDAGEEQVVSAAGSYDLVATYADDPGVRLLRIRRPAAPLATDPSMGYPLRSGWLSIELRAEPPAGPWDRLEPGSPALDGVLIRYVEDGYDDSELGALPALGTSFLVDTVPGTVGTSMWDPDFHDAPLAVGQTFADPVTGTEVTLASLDVDGATVAVAFPSGGPSPAPSIAAPAVSGVVAGDGQATVTWNAPPTAGSHPPVGYTARSHPGGERCVALAYWPRSCTVTGLANGTTYRFTVTAATEGAHWRTSLPSEPVTPAGPPTARVLGLPAYLATRSVRVAWDGQDDGGPVDSYDVRYRAAPWNGTFGSHAGWQTATTATTASLYGKPGRTYCFSARSRNDGATGPWSAEACTAVPLDDRSLKPSGAWTAVTGSALYRGTALRTTRSGASVTRTNVVARRIALLASTCATCGSVKVYWNGAYRRTVSLRSGTSRHRVLIGLLSFASVRSGTLRLVASTSGGRVQVDAVAISRR